MSTPGPELDWVSPEFSENLRSAVEALGQAVNAPPLEVQRFGCEAEKRVVRMRDELIGRLRSEPEGLQAKKLLEQVNGVLSLIVGIEYPSNFVRREMIQQTHDALQSLLR
jgi:hypothetical protein